MERSLRVSSGPACLDLHAQVSTASVEPRQSVLTTAVGASYAFDPGVDGLASIYAARVLERGIDPRVLCAEIRADRLGLVDRGPQRRALMARTRTSRFGRGTAAHLRSQASPIQLSPESKSSPEKGDQTARRTSSADRAMDFRSAGRASSRRQVSPPSSCYRSASSSRTPRTPRCSHATSCSLATRSRASPRSLVSHPAAILAASAIQNPPLLAPAEIIVIPDPSESPEAAAWNASQQEGASPFVVRCP